MTGGSSLKCAKCDHYTFVRETQASPLSAGFNQAEVSERYGVKTYKQYRPKGTQKGHSGGPDKPCRSTKGFHWEPTEEFWPDGRRRYVKITDRCPCPAFVAREDPLAYPATDVPFTDRSPQEARP